MAGSIVARRSAPTISLTALVTPTKNSISAPSGQRSVTTTRDCRPFPTHVAVTDDGDAERPFRLIAAPSRSFLNTTFNNVSSSIARERRPRALIHSSALANLGVLDGERVRIGNQQGSVVVHARAFDGLQRRVVIVEGNWPDHAFEEGIGINPLISAEPGLPRGGAVFHDTSVWLRPA